MAEKDSWAVGSDADRRVDVEDARAATSALLAPSATIAGRAGFLAGPATQGQVTATGTPNANVNVAAFQAVLANSRGTFPYLVTLDSPKIIDVLVANPSDPTNPRRDLIIAQQSDAYYGDSSSPFEVRRVTGTPAASPSDPVPTGSPDYITLARITVTAGATTITSGMITDLRPAQIAVARGGVLPCTSLTRPSSPYAGMTIFETDTGITYIWNATAATWSQVWTQTSGQMSTTLPIRTTAGGDASHASTTHGLQIGASSGLNLRMDNNEIMVANNGASDQLRIQFDGGKTVFGGDVDIVGPVLADSTITASPAEGSSSQALLFNHGHSVYVDNVNVAGAAGSRFWLDTPNNADVVIGPRAGGDAINDLRLRCDATTASTANMFLSASTYSVARSTSSLRYKVDVVDLDLDLAAVRALRPVRFRDRGEVERDPETTQTYIGLIAEEVHDLGLSSFVAYMDTDEGKIPDGVQYDRITLASLMLIGELEDTVAAQASEITALQDALAALTTRVEALEAP